MRDGDYLVGNGVVAQARNGKVQLVPWHESVTDRRNAFKNFEQTAQVDWGVQKQPKRAPGERLASLFLRYHNMAVERQKITGRYELPREMFQEMQLECWKDGTPLTEETLRQMVARGLERAEREYRVNGANRSAKEDYHYQGVIEVNTKKAG